MPRVSKELKEAAQLALDVQNGCNLAGVVNGWARVQRVVIEDASGTATARFKQHPIQVLFLSKVVSLMAVATDGLGGVYDGAIDSNGSRDLFSAAYDACLKLASAPES